MQNSRPIPDSLTTVAVLFILGGIWAVIEMAVSLTDDRIKIEIGVLGLFIGPGLLRRSPGWRTCALAYLWIAMIGAPIGAMIWIGYSGPLDLTLIGRIAGHASREVGVAVAAIVFVVAVWQYRVLTRPDIRQLFYLRAGH